MSSTVPPVPLPGSQAPSTIEMLWETHRRKITILCWLLLAILGGYYAIKYYEQRQLDKEWSDFAAITLLRSGYAPESTDFQNLVPIENALVEELGSADLAALERAAQGASAAQRPYVLWLIANRALMLGDWARVESALAELEKGYPNHVLTRETSHPIQVREEIKKEGDSEAVDAKGSKEPELKPAMAGSMVSLLRARMAVLRDFVEPAQFRKPGIPADAPRYRIKFSDRGEVVIALMTQQAPAHCAEFEKLVEQNFWDGIRVDEVQRPVGKNAWFKLSQFHFGFASTRKANRAEWDTTTTSEHLVDEVTGLSHFPGAVAARADAEGRSQIDRLWFCATDAASQDGFRQVFAYVVEGLETVKDICETTLSSSQEEDMGRGKPAEDIVVESIVKL